MKCLRAKAKAKGGSRTGQTQRVQGQRQRLGGSKARAKAVQGQGLRRFKGKYWGN